MPHHPLRVAFFAALAASCWPAAAAPAQEIRRTYAIRVDDKIVGYQIETERPHRENGRELVEVEIASLAKLEILGSPIDQRIEQTWLVDPQTRATVRMRSRLATGDVAVVAAGALSGDGFAFTADGKDTQTLDPARVVIAPDYRWLWQRAPSTAGSTAEIDWCMPEFASVSKARVALVAADVEVRVLDASERANTWSIELSDLGLTFTVSVTKAGQTVRYEIPAMRTIVELAPPAVIERLQRVDLTHTIVGKTNLDLDDATPLTYMKVRVVANATPDVTVAGLSAPGQTFTGTVENGRVEGIFELRPVRSDGRGAIAFPVPDGAFADTALQPCLQPGPGIESDDPAIVAQARQLAIGATDCFQVVRQLADWVHANIEYAIPGGVTAKRTFELRQGDCGGHSHLLAAMLRSLGIPARTPMGAMYVPLYGGAFGQHMWNEIWLGEAIGWLAVDCTAGQPTFVDASHIRLLGKATAFRPESVEVLAWGPRSAQGPADAAVRRHDEWPWQVGETVTWTWRRAGKDLGKETMTYEGAVAEGHAFASALDLADGVFTETARTVVAADGSVRTFRGERSTGGKRTTFAITVNGKQAIVTQQEGEEDRRAEVDVTADVFALHNNCIAHFSLIAARLGALAEGAATRVRVVHSEVHSQLGVEVRGGAKSSLLVGGVDTPVQLVTVTIAGTGFEMHVDDRGRLVRWQQDRGDIVVERKP